MMTVGKLMELNYIEKIYPREVNTYTKSVREREKFDFFGWDSKRENRNIVLSGNVAHETDQNLLSVGAFNAFPSYTSLNKKDFRVSFFGQYDALDVASTSNILDIAGFISASTWVLDSRGDIAEYPVNITGSYFGTQDTFLAQRDQAARNGGVPYNPLYPIVNVL